MKVRCIIIAGGLNSQNVEIITGDLGNRQLQPLWKNFYRTPMALHDGEILLFGNERYELELQCFKLSKKFVHDFVHNFNEVKKYRRIFAVVTTEKATFLFGVLTKSSIYQPGWSSQTYEYLPKGSTTWQEGKNPIPRGILSGCAIAIKSDQEILLIGDRKRILSFNTSDHTFKVLPTRLHVDRSSGSRCAFIPGTNKVIITGGTSISTEIFNIEDGSITMGSRMNFARCNHGIGLITVNDEDRLAVFGGSYDGTNSVEIYNTRTGKWEISDIKLKEPTSGFGYLSLRLSDILPKL